MVFQLEPVEEGTSVGGLVDALVGLGIDRVSLLDDTIDMTAWTGPALDVEDAEALRLAWAAT